MMMQIAHHIYTVKFQNTLNIVYYTFGYVLAYTDVCFIWKRFFNLFK